MILEIAHLDFDKEILRRLKNVTEKLAPSRHSYERDQGALNNSTNRLSWVLDAWILRCNCYSAPAILDLEARRTVTFRLSTMSRSTKAAPQAKV